MTKIEFLNELRANLIGLPESEIEERLLFYSEMIDDKMEEGLTQEEAVSTLGSVENIVSQIKEEIPLSKLFREKLKPRHTLSPAEIILIILGFPLWFPLLISFGAVVLSFYVVIWAIIITLYAIDISFAAVSFGVLFAAFSFMYTGNMAGGGFAIGASLMCAGIAILLFFGCNIALEGLFILTKKMILKLKSCFFRKESAK